MLEFEVELLGKVEAPTFRVYRATVGFSWKVWTGMLDERPGPCKSAKESKSPRSTGPHASTIPQSAISENGWL